MFSYDLLLDALVLGLLLGCFYAAVSIGLSLSFGLLDVPHIAHPAFLVLGAYGTWQLNRFGLDPILAGVALMPVFFLLGMGIYRFYYETFEKRGSDAGLRGLAFFFGVVFFRKENRVKEHFRLVPWIWKPWRIGFWDLFSR